MRAVAVVSALLLIGLAGLVQPSRSASFDCAKAAHPLEKIICNTPSLSKLDGDLAAQYRAKLARLFDKLGFRTQQRNWQQLLRAKCTKGCSATDVERDYQTQLATIGHIDSETYEASYKTADVATLRVQHLNDQQFDFSIRRELDDKLLCAIPANDLEAGTIATLKTPNKASWQVDGCNIDFLLTRDSMGHVSRIDTAASTGCSRYCRGGRGYGLGDVYLPANDWTASNQ